MVNPHFQSLPRAHLPRVHASAGSSSLRLPHEGGGHHTHFTDRETETHGNQRSGVTWVQCQANCSSPDVEMTDFNANCSALLFSANHLPYSVLTTGHRHPPSEGL